MSSGSDSDMSADSECSQHSHDSPPCYYCGDTDCFGSCNDPDVCPSCWIYENVPTEYTHSYYDDEVEPIDTCMEVSCTCRCHADIYEDMGVRFEAGVEWVDEPVYEREGVFPLLKLPGEIRERIYGYAFLQEGGQRKHPSTMHRGSIHTNLLRTCKQVYREAGNLPLTLNNASFSSPLYALDFIGCLLMPRLQHLVKKLRLEYHYCDFGNPAFKPLIRELAKIPLTHLSITIKGGVLKENLLGHCCWLNPYKELKHLKVFELFLGSAMITEKGKEQIQEMCREELIDGYVRPKELKRKATGSKRPAPNDDHAQTERPTKKAKQVFPTKHQAKIIPSPSSKRLGLRSTKFEREAAAKAITEEARLSLLSQYALIKEYATSVEFDAASVKIRLEKAHKAAEAADKSKFASIVHGITATLSERFEIILAARSKVLPILGSVLPPVISPESSTSSDTPTSSGSSIEL